MSPLSARAHVSSAAPSRSPSARPKPSSRPGHLRVVVPAKRPHLRVSPGLVVVSLLMVVVVTFGVAIAQVFVAQGQVRLDRMEEELSLEQDRYQALRKDVAELESPSRVVAAAEKQGMVVPEDVVYLQPSTPEVEGASPTGGVEADTAWSTVKPLLAAPAP